MGFRDFDRYPDVRVQPPANPEGSHPGYGRIEFTPRTDHPLGGFVRHILPQLLRRWHPLLRALDLWLLLREIEAQTQGGGTAPRSRFLTGATNPNVPRSIILPIGYGHESCPGWPGPAGVLAPRIPTGGQTCGAPEAQSQFDQSDASLMAQAQQIARMAAGGTLIPMWSEKDFFGPPGTRLYEGAVVTPFTAPPREEVPEWAPLPSAVEVTSPMGLGAPNELQRPREQLGHLGLPNMVAPRTFLTLREAALVHAGREAMGLRQSLPRETAGAQGLPFANPEDSSQRRLGPREFVRELGGELPPWGILKDNVRETEAPEGGIEVYPQLRPAEPHVTVKPRFYVKESKWRTTKEKGELEKTVSESYVASKTVLSAVTETGDFVENMWDGLPRDLKTAGTGPRGNRRIDSMLKDIYRGWNEIDWGRVLDNIQWNAVQDYAIGAASAVAAGALAIATGRSSLGVMNAFEGRAYFSPRELQTYGIRTNDYGEGYVVQMRGPDSGGFIRYPDQGYARSIGGAISEALGWLQARGATAFREAGYRPGQNDAAWISDAQRARGWAKVPQAAAQNWFDYRVIDGFPYAMLRGGQSLDYRPPAPPWNPGWEARSKVKAIKAPGVRPPKADKYAILLGQKSRKRTKKRYAIKQSKRGYL